MKKNIKFRNNGGNSNAYSLNYKFDSISPAGKISGTALDLIKKYNELAKEAHGSGDYIEMEVYRQYAEHYRKIVTEINERKNMRQENGSPAPVSVAPEAQPQSDETVTPAPATNSDNNENSNTEANVVNNEQPKKIRKSFKVVEIKLPENNAEASADTPKVSAPRKGRKTLQKTMTVELENRKADAI